MYGAGMIPGLSHSSAKFSGVHLNERHTGATSRGATANILPSTLNTRSAPHCTFSVAWGKLRQCLRIFSMSIVRLLLLQFRPGTNHHALRVSNAESSALHIALRSAARQSADYGKFASGLRRFPKTPVDECR